MAGAGWDVEVAPEGALNFCLSVAISVLAFGSPVSSPSLVLQFAPHCLAVATMATSGASFMISEMARLSELAAQEVDPIAKEMYYPLAGEISRALKSQASASASSPQPCFRGSGAPPTPIPVLSKAYAKECVDAAKFVLAAEREVETVAAGAKKPKPTVVNPVSSPSLGDPSSAAVGAAAPPCRRPTHWTEGASCTTAS